MAGFVIDGVREARVVDMAGGRAASALAIRSRPEAADVPVTGTASLRATGMRRTTMRARPNAIHGLGLSLRAGESLEIRQSLCDGQVGFEVRVCAVEAGGGCVASRLRALRRDVACGLVFAYPELMFEDADAPGSAMVLWRAAQRFVPRGYSIDVTRRAGMPAISSRGGNQSATAVSTLTASRVRMSGSVECGRNASSNDLGALMRSLALECEIVLRLAPVRILEPAAESLARARVALRDRPRVNRDDGGGILLTGSPAIAELASQVDAWLDTGGGVRADLSLLGPEPMPAVFLDAVAETAMPAVPGTWVLRAVGDDEPAIGGALDLRGCTPRGMSAPLIAAPVASFLDAGSLPASPPPHMPARGCVIGHATYGAARRPVRLDADARLRHCYVVGATGTGKSTLMANMALADIRAGRGVCVLDPHGDLQQDLVAAIPASRARDVLAIDIGDADRTIGLNLLARDDGATRRVSFAINEIMAIIEALYAAVPESIGPAFEQYLRFSLTALAWNRRRNGTLADAFTFFTDHDFRDHVVAGCTQPRAQAFFEGMALRATGDYSFENFALYVANKLNRFIASDYVRPIIAQRSSTLDIRACMDEGRILLVNLNKGMLGTVEARLVGMLLMTEIFGTALERAARPRDARRPFHVYVDEAQNFTTPSLSNMLAEARKFGLSLTLANQNLGQVAGGAGANLLDAILGNAGSLLMFRVGALDAGLLSTFTSPEFDARQLQYLPDRNVVARILSGGRPLPPFLFEVDAWKRRRGPPSAAAAQLRRNFEHHTVPRTQVGGVDDAAPE